LECILKILMSFSSISVIGSVVLPFIKPYKFYYYVLDEIALQLVAKNPFPDISTILVSSIQSYNMIDTGLNLLLCIFIFWFWV
jgi:hypothetical protein